MGRRRMAAVTLVAMVAAAAGGCGGDDDGGSGGLSKAELEKQSGKICTEGRAAFNKISEPADISDPAQAAPYFTAVLDAASTQITKLKELKPADDLKADYDAYLAELETSRTMLQGIRDKAQAKDPSGLEDLQRLTEGGRDKAVSDAATKAGLTTCAKN